MYLLLISVSDHTIYNGATRCVEWRIIMVKRSLVFLYGSVLACLALTQIAQADDLFAYNPLSHVQLDSALLSRANAIAMHLIAYMESKAPSFSNYNEDQVAAINDPTILRKELNKAIAAADFYREQSHLAISEEAVAQVTTPPALPAGTGQAPQWPVWKQSVCGALQFLIAGYSAASPQFVSSAGSVGQKNTLSIIGGSVGVIPIALLCTQPHANP
jgi:hypothetical protein